jgi:hypothetical protein
MPPLSIRGFVVQSGGTAAALQIPTLGTEAAAT